MRLALLGDPVGHSRSPAMHTAALAAVGIEGTYVARTTDADGVAGAVEEIRRGELFGANVTMPLKAVALDAVDTVSLEAIRSGAVNTLVLGEGAVRGENTDVGGLVDVATRRELPADAPILVLGAGGAAGAALVAFEDRDIAISARRDEAAARLAALTSVEARLVPWGSAVAGAIVVNATPIGMVGDDLPHAVLRAAAGLVDLAYGPAPTPAVVFAAGRIPVVDGIDHLVAQAARSFVLWTGIPAPIDVMTRAARGS